MRIFMLGVFVALFISGTGCVANQPHGVAAHTIQSSRCVSDLEQLGREDPQALVNCAAFSRLAFNQRSIDNPFSFLLPGPYFDRDLRHSPCVVDLTQLDEVDGNMCNMLAELELANIQDAT